MALRESNRQDFREIFEQLVSSLISNYESSEIQGIIDILLVVERHVQDLSQVNPEKASYILKQIITIHRRLVAGPPSQFALQRFRGALYRIVGAPEGRLGSPELGQERQSSNDDPNQAPRRVTGANQLRPWVIEFTFREATIPAKRAFLLLWSFAEALELIPN